MLELSRTVRFCLASDSPQRGNCLAAPRHNTFSAWPPMRGLGRYYQLQVRCQGQADPETGYFINIKHIDQAVRTCVLPLLRRAITREQAPEDTAFGSLMQQLLTALQPPLNHTVTSLVLQLTPWLSLNIESHAMSRVIFRQQYEFSAAHRLHAPSLSDEENQQVFGKCNNPAGHGHNYLVQVAVACPIDGQGSTFWPEDLDALVDEHCIEILDHKHLNLDVPQFADRNPSVEHIAQVIWNMLEKPLRRLGELEEISVWETGKTVCTYRGPQPAPPSSPLSR